MSGIPELVVVTADPTPPYEQLRRQLDGLIRSGVLPAGSRLPPLRQLAGDLGLAVGTVARTYRELETAGLIRSRRGGGTRVAEPPSGEAAWSSSDGDARMPESPAGAASVAGMAPTEVAAVLRGAAAELVRRARAAGAEPAEIIAAVRLALDDIDQLGPDRWPDCS